VKVAVILVPIFFLIFLPSIFLVYAAVKGKNSDGPGTPVTQAPKKINILLAFGYLLVSLASACWALYVFSGSKVGAAAFGAYCLILMAISIVINRRSWGKPRPTPEELNKQADIQAKRILPFILVFTIPFIVIAIAGLIIIIYVVMNS
jgi:hypothetical protein